MKQHTSICRLPFAFKEVQLRFKNTLVRCQSTKSKLATFYDTLNLKPGCSKKDIRNSFIKFSKLNHPDVCGPTSNDRFIRINEAYNVLIKEDKKKLYNETLIDIYVNRYPIYYYHPSHTNRYTWKDVYDNNSWLSSNVTIVGFCLSVLIIGSIIRYYGFKWSSSTRNSLIDKSNKTLSLLEEQRLMHIDKSKDELIQIFETNIAKEYGHFIKK